MGMHLDSSRAVLFGSHPSGDAPLPWYTGKNRSDTKKGKFKLS